jgi:hypothetical protein
MDPVFAKTLSGLSFPQWLLIPVAVLGILSGYKTGRILSALPSAITLR